MQKRIIFLDVSGSICYSELWKTAKIVLKACLTQDKDLDTYVCLFSSDVRLITEKELQQLFNAEDHFKFFDSLKFQSGIGSEVQNILKFFPIDFVKDAEIEVISDFMFQDAFDAKSLMLKSWEECGKAKVIFHELNEELVELLTITKQELETEKKEEKTPEKIFEPTRKGKE